MKDLLLRLVTIGVLAVLALLFFRLWQEQKDQARRWEQNYEQTQEEIGVLVMRFGEFRKHMDQKTDSILEVAKIKPRWVREVTEIHHHYFNKDTTIVEMKYDPLTGVYPFLDEKECFTFGGYIEMLQDKPQLSVTERKYDDDVNVVVYERRKRFLGLRIGRKETFMEVQSKCGTNEVRRIEVEKRRTP